MSMRMELAGGDHLLREPWWQAVTAEFAARGLELRTTYDEPLVAPLDVSDADLEDLIAICAVIGSASDTGTALPDLPQRSRDAAPPPFRRSRMGRLLHTDPPDRIDPYERWSRPVDPPRNVEADPMLSSAAAWPVRYRAPLVPFADVIVPLAFSGTMVLAVPSHFDVRTAVISSYAAEATLSDIGAFLQVPAELVGAGQDAWTCAIDAAARDSDVPRWAAHADAAWFVVALLPMLRASVATGAPVVLR
jgi:hypothetical protein